MRRLGRFCYRPTIASEIPRSLGDPEIVSPMTPYDPLRPFHSSGITVFSNSRDVHYRIMLEESIV